MVLMVVVVTTFATAQEAAKQYDGLRDQANQWATSRLLASLLNTSAPVEELIETQVVSTSCSAEERSDEQPARQQPATLTTYRLIETKSTDAPQRDEAIRIAVNETPATFDMQHSELSEANRESLERLDEVARLTEKNHFAELEALGQLEEAKESLGAPDEHDTEDDSVAHTQAAMHFINRVITQVPSPRVSETDSIAVRARAAADARVQQRAARRAVRILQERTERPVRFELKRIKKGDQTSGTTTMLRAANSGSTVDAATAEDAECELRGQLAVQDIDGTSPQSAPSGE
jgi:hypothetical protein